jgi:hypothetical protein
MDKSDDMKKYHIEAWYSGGRLPIIAASYKESLESIVRNNYIPTITIEDTNKKPYLVNYGPDYFTSLLNEDIYFYEPGDEGFSACVNEKGHHVEKMEELKPGDYLMNIRIWAAQNDVVFSYDCYIHIIIPGAENLSSWPVVTPTPPPASDPVPYQFLSSDGDWITPVPALLPTSFLFAESLSTPTPTPALTPTPLD